MINKIIMALGKGGAGTDIEVGSPLTFISTNSSDQRVVGLSATKAIVVYTDNSSNYKGTACILDVSGSTLTAGTPVIHNTSITGSSAVTMLTSTKALIVYKNAGNSGRGTACVLDVSGTTITVGTSVVFATGSIDQANITSLTSTKAIVTFHDTSAKRGRACVLDVSGSTITAGGLTNYNTTGSSYSNVVATLTSTKALVVYENTTNGSYLTTRVLDVSGSTITLGSAVLVQSANLGYIDLTGLSSTKALVVYADTTNGNYGTARVLSVSGTTITVGSAAVFASAVIRDSSVTTLTEDRVMNIYKDIDDGSDGKAIILDVAGTTVTSGTPVTYDATSNNPGVIAVLPETEVEAIVVRKGSLIGFHLTNV